VSTEAIGDVGEPIKAGNSLVLGVEVVTQSGTAFDLAGWTSLQYALFHYSGDVPLASPAFVLSAPSSGITVVNQSLGLLDIAMTNSITALMGGRNHGVLRLVNPAGYYDLLDGIVVSTRALAF
jgi:hypothetical protein